MTTNTKKIQLAAGALLLPFTFLFGSIASADTYTVQSGDTLSELAVKFNTTVDSLVSWNSIVNPSLIYTGQTLEIGDTNTNTDTATPVSTAVSTSESSSTTQSTTTSYSSNLDTTEAAAKEEIARRESGGSYTAQNGQYYGRYQLTISYLNGDLSPENQERVADAYVAGRYGSWSAALAFWNANGWY